MLVKMLDGAFAGEIKDLRPDVALEWIRQKRAEKAFADSPPAAVIEPFALVDDTPVRGPKAAKAARKTPNK